MSGEWGGTIINAYMRRVRWSAVEGNGPEISGWTEHRRRTSGDNENVVFLSVQMCGVLHPQAFVAAFSGDSGRNKTSVENHGDKFPRLFESQ